MDFFDFRAKENADPEAVLENCFGKFCIILVEDCDNAQILGDFAICNKLLVDPH